MVNYFLAKLFCACNLQVESIVLSIISMLSSPNDESPANIEAAVSALVVYLQFSCPFLRAALSLDLQEERKIILLLQCNVVNVFILFTDFNFTNR